MNAALGDLYQKVIVEHSRNPRNHGPLAGATAEARVTNPLCGDEVTVRVRVANGCVEDVRFEGRGCILSRAAASMMTEAVRGKSVADVLKAEQAFAGFIAGTGATGEVGELGVLQGVREYPSRVGCVMLAWEAVVKAVR